LIGLAFSFVYRCFRTVLFFFGSHLKHPPPSSVLSSSFYRRVLTVFPCPGRYSSSHGFIDFHLCLRQKFSRPVLLACVWFPHWCCAVAYFGISVCLMGSCPPFFFFCRALKTRCTPPLLAPGLLKPSFLSAFQSVSRRASAPSSPVDFSAFFSF